MARPSSGGHRCRGLRLAGIVLLAAIRAASEDTMEEYQLKAGFVYNIAKFVEWPAEALAHSNDPLIGCILGDSPLGAVLEQAAGNRAIHGRKLVVRSISAPRETRGCHFVFVSLSAQKAWRAASDYGRLGGMLTIGEGDALDGVIVNLKRDGDKIRIQVDLDAARHGKLQISSKLLSLSEIVKR
jgi:uncharacterized protein DUF4154